MKTKQTKKSLARPTRTQKRTKTQVSAHPSTQQQNLPGFTELLTHAWNLSTARLGSLLVVSIFSTLVQFSMVVVFGVAAAALGLTKGVTLFLEQRSLAGLLTPEFLWAFAVLAVTFFICIVVQSMLTQATLVRLLFHKQEGILLSFKESVSKFWLVLAVSLFSSFLTIGGMSLLIIPGLIFSLLTMFAFFEVVIYGTGAIAAISKSTRVVLSHFWAVLGRITLLLFLTLLVMSVFDSVAVSVQESSQFIVGLASYLLRTLVSLMWLAFVGQLYLSVRSSTAENTSVIRTMVLVAVAGWVVMGLMGSNLLKFVRSQPFDFAPFISELETAVGQEVDWDVEPTSLPGTEPSEVRID